VGVSLSQRVNSYIQKLLGVRGELRSRILRTEQNVLNHRHDKCGLIFRYLPSVFHECSFESALGIV
jgi:hypothetical protein